MADIDVNLNLFVIHNPQVGANIFKSAEYWLNRGYLIQSAKTSKHSLKEKNSEALDYYLSGVKIDPTSFGCAYNIACTYFTEQKYVNAHKWFNLALCIDSNS